MAPNMSTYESKVMGNALDHTSSTSMMPYSHGQEAIYGQMNRMDEVDPDMVFYLSSYHNLVLIYQHQQAAFGCDTAPFAEQWWFPVLQPTQVHSQPVVHKQEMIYPQPISAAGYSEWNQSTMIGSNFPAYSQAMYADSAFQDSEASHSYLKVETELDSDSGQSMRCASTFNNDGPARRGPFKSLHDRAQTAQTRKDGSCVRCRAQKIRVCAPSAVSYYADR